MFTGIINSKGMCFQKIQRGWIEVAWTELWQVGGVDFILSMSDPCQIGGPVR
jgi:hypothetical protein